jgi:co-chaperonin GroES (HSP10)
MEGEAMRLQPVGRSLLVHVKQPEMKSKLILTAPAQHSGDPVQAYVIGVGEKVEAPVKEGDLLLLSPYCGTKVAGGTDEAPYLLIGEKEVLGILKEAVGE